jgi:amidophosphoribosyltransferase
MCAIVGVFGAKKASTVAYYSLFSLQHRGQEATGISVANGEKIKLYKKRGMVADVFSQATLDSMEGSCAVGHNRYSTAGSESQGDAQPVFAKYKLGEISVVHNGNLVNKHEVRNELIAKGAIFQTDMDTENIIHLIAKSQKDALVDRIKDMLTKIEGAYCLAIQSRSKMFVIRDRFGIRPLSLGKLKDGGWIVASETCAFELVGAEFVRDVKPGEMLIFEEGKEPFSEQIFEPDYHPCAFEYIYFARPDSIIDGKNVYAMRLEMGRRLAQETPADIDLVLPVPDSGVAAARGYAEGLGVPFEMGIVRNHYVGRTFIEPTQEIRDLKVKMKLSPMKSFKVKLYKLIKKILPKEMLEEWQDRFGSDDYKSSKGIMRKILVKVVNEDIRNKIETIEIPVLLIWGENDTATPIKAGNIMHNKLKKSVFILIPNSGHFPFLDNPNIIASYIEEFYKDDR